MAVMTTILKNIYLKGYSPTGGTDMGHEQKIIQHHFYWASPSSL